MLYYGQHVQAFFCLHNYCLSMNITNISPYFIFTIIPYLWNNNCYHYFTPMIFMQNVFLDDRGIDHLNMVYYIFLVQRNC